MPDIYLRHPRHGQKVAHNEAEAKHDKEHGWEEFDPSSEQPSPPVDPNKPTAEIVAELAAANERAEKAEAKVAELKAEVKELKVEVKALKAAAPAPQPPTGGVVPDFLKGDKPSA